MIRKKELIVKNKFVRKEVVAMIILMRAKEIREIVHHSREDLIISVQVVLARRKERGVKKINHFLEKLRKHLQSFLPILSQNQKQKKVKLCLMILMQMIFWKNKEQNQSKFIP